MEKQKRIAWISPIADDRPLLSALYSGLLIPETSKYFEIELFTDDPDLEPGNLGAARRLEQFVPIFHYHRLAERDAADPFEGAIYQLDDDERSAFVYRIQQLLPGIVYRHDLNLNRLLLSAFRHSTGGTDIDREARSQFGPAAPPLGAYTVRNWPIEIFDRLLQRTGRGGSINLFDNLLLKADFDGQNAEKTGNGSGPERAAASAYLEPPAPAELFSFSDRAKPSADLPLILGLTGCRELEDRVEWCGDLLTAVLQRLDSRLVERLEIQWWVHTALVDRSAARVLEALQRRIPQLQVRRTGSTAEYLAAISRFSLFLASKLRAGRALPFELRAAAAAGTPVIASDHLLDDLQQSVLTAAADFVVVPAAGAEEIGQISAAAAAYLTAVWSLPNGWGAERQAPSQSCSAAAAFPSRFAGLIDSILQTYGSAARLAEDRLCCSFSAARLQLEQSREDLRLALIGGRPESELAQGYQELVETVFK